MKERVITGFIMALIFIPFLLLPPLYFYVLVAILVILASYEMYRMFENIEHQPSGIYLFQLLATLLFYGIGLAVFLTRLAPIWLGIYFMMMIIIGLSLIVLVPVFTGTRLGKTLMAILYVGGAFAAVSMVRSLGIWLLVYMLLLTMLTDMFAYFIGIRYGKHKLAETISPKKTIEGAIGGTVVAVLVASLFAGFMAIYPFNHWLVLIVVMVLAGVFVSMAAQLGDLVASALKREHGIKDFSKIFPGHGGIMDRFDSTIFAALALMIVMLFIEVF